MEKQKRSLSSNNKGRKTRDRRHKLNQNQEYISKAEEANLFQQVDIQDEKLLVCVKCLCPTSAEITAY